jgi:hypothetical protein
MTAKKNSDYHELLHLAGSYLSNVVKFHLQDSESKDFMLWILRNNNQHQENYLRMLGIAGSIELELKLFKNVIHYPLTLYPLGNYISLLNAYFGYETLSDNLAVGLAAAKRRNNKNYMHQKKVLLYFNEIMLKKIKGSAEDLYALFKPISNAIKHISVHRNTLSPEQMDAFTNDYAHYHPAGSRADLEHTFLEILILNVATCTQLLNSLHRSSIYNILKKSLMARYLSVSHIVKQSQQATLPMLASWGLHSILTIPTLAYCIGALEVVSPHKAFKLVISKGLLYEAMADAALLTRLLNDIGTRLLVLSADERKTLYRQFQDLVDSSRFNAIFCYLCALSEHAAFSDSLTRIRKDLKQGEFNICLDTLKDNQPLRGQMVRFCQSIDYYATLYQTTTKKLHKKLSLLSDIMGDAQISNIIGNFVVFHKVKYRMEYETTRGDYAITQKMIKRR